MKNIRNLFLATVASTAIAASASANYFAGVTGQLNVADFVYSAKDDKITGVKMKRPYDFGGRVFVGYNLMESFGLGLEVGGYMSPSYTSVDAAKSTTSDFLASVGPQSANTVAEVDTFKTSNKSFAGVTTKVKNEFTVGTLLLNGTFTLANFEVAELFISAGVGGAYLCETYTVSADANTDFGSDAKTVTVKMKSVYNLAGRIGAGVAVPLSDSAALTLGAEYFYAGNSGAEFETDADKAASESLTVTADTAAYKGGTLFDAINVTLGFKLAF